ncbi:3-methyl-2-oxobutanoate hydroxymethyltransferase [Myxococcus xanthus]|uniref:3-methyl-2-oxobutanoate hydroxymethyltransferase n=1 Tax=Myxococcus xanthus TaxID=34 RepID=A0AAE6FXU3_MYXXA|nr:3-methyl-2-oxobutanoate hydroxymethyltransferase [Myxococcus xanthus]QDE67257.1 3-methyl-2-oxobutanoate hydroxymethyltransferase [Myxococcus xanthus]QDE74532.1 3-methyl-2-oxobutanoate hydroxymethyltransferase [Myxococcus xanthus]QDE96116.1 3-methyl-2-oxobutanoate hydroxymethyltransferase [Myxococcus xanthus]QDF03569.1 3-methyl-2-oxobutanoate hydroxymethyltransferase [Myxococcus xanthus]
MKDKVTIHTLKRFKQIGQKICMVTAYDATFAHILEEAGADVLLIGDSLGMVIQGHDSTLPVTMDQMVYHTAAVARGARRAHVVADLPFMSYQVSNQEAVRNAGRLVAEGGAGSIKMEGGAEFADTVRAIVRASIPVMGHLGLTPQSVHKMGGYVVQGRGDDQARQILDDALALEQAGAYALVLEGVPMDLARTVTQRLSIPTIGIGAGVDCDGQVLVCYDLLGMNPDFKPKFVKRYANLHGSITDAAGTYFAEVRKGAFPDEEHSFKANKNIRLATGAPAPAARVEPSAPTEDGEKMGPVYGRPA